MTFFVEDEIPVLPDPPLVPTSPGAPEVAAAASTTLLVVLTLLTVLLPLTDTTVVRNCAVTLPVFDDEEGEDVEWELALDVTEDLDSVDTLGCD